MLKYLTCCAAIINYNSLFTKFCQGKIQSHSEAFSFRFFECVMGNRGALLSARIGVPNPSYKSDS